MKHRLAEKVNQFTSVQEILEGVRSHASYFSKVDPLNQPGQRPRRQSNQTRELMVAVISVASSQEPFTSKQKNPISNKANAQRNCQIVR